VSALVAPHDPDCQTVPCPYDEEVEHPERYEPLGPDIPDGLRP